MASHNQTLTEQAAAEPPAAAIDAMRATAERWRVTWTDGRERTTTLVGLAWYAREFDDDATVTPVDAG